MSEVALLTARKLAPRDARQRRRPARRRGGQARRGADALSVHRADRHHLASACSSGIVGEAVFAEPLADWLQSLGMEQTAEQHRGDRASS